MAGFETDAPGTTQLLMGNEAIARGALEAGIGFAAAYPGTPSSEILGSLAPVAEKMGMYAEWSINEMVAMEAAAGAALFGIRALAAMKQNGTQVVIDFLGNLVMRGLGGGGLVLVSCDDPSAHSSSNEQDTRPVAKWLDIPLLEPGDFQEAKDMTKWLFDLAEEIDNICMLRSVTRIAHARGNVKLGELPKREHRVAQRAPVFRGMPPHASLHQKLATAQGKFESSPFNRYVGPDKSELLIITGGSCWLHSQEAVKALGVEDRVGILKLGTLWPLPEKFVESHLGKSDKVLVVEEIDPFIEQNVMELVANLPLTGPHPTFYGKRSGHINAYGELNPDMVIKAITSILGISYEPRDIEYAKKADEATRGYVPPRRTGFCPGCPHRATFWAMKNALRLDGREGFVTGDIGCYAMAGGPTGFFQTRTIYCMGASAGIANGLGQLWRFGLDKPILAVCGDSTFFHATIPALISGIWNDSNFTLVVLDNSATAMTGFQPHPGTGVTAMGERTHAISIEAICRSLGARVEICDPFDLKNTTTTLLEVLSEEGGAKVVIMRHECELVRARREIPPYRVHVDPEICVGATCGCDRLCTRVFLCPGLIWDEKAGRARIDEVICAGCGVCVDICPQRAIIKEAA